MTVESYVIPYGVALARFLTRNKPVISLLTMTGGDFYNEDAIGNIKHLSYSPSMLSPYTGQMSLWERLENWVTHHYVSSRLQNIFESSARAHFRDTYGPDGETLVDGCWENISLAMISSNALYYYPRPITPNVIEVGPLHIKTPEKLPKVKYDCNLYHPAVLRKTLAPSLYCRILFGGTWVSKGTFSVYDYNCLYVLMIFQEAWSWIAVTDAF